MLRISTIDDDNERRLVLEGKLIEPWTAEVKSVLERASEHLQGRQVVVELRYLTVISQEGEMLLAGMINDGVRFRSSGAFATELIRQLTAHPQRARVNEHWSR